MVVQIGDLLPNFLVEEVEEEGALEYSLEELDQGFQTEEDPPEELKSPVDCIYIEDPAYTKRVGVLIRSWTPKEEAEKHLDPQPPLQPHY